MRHLVVGATLLMLGGLLSACGPQLFFGSMAFDIDLAQLQAASGKGDDRPITAATVTLEREGFETIESELQVSNGVARGQIDDLAAGFWNVTVDVFSEQVQIFTGETDVQVFPGLTVRATILFDPVPIPPEDGSIEFEIGLNPVPGFKPLNLQVSEVLQSESRDEIYIYDSSLRLIAVFNGATMNRVRDYVLSDTPATVALSHDESAFLLGDPRGQVFTLDLDTEERTFVGDFLRPLFKIAPISDTLIAASVRGAREVITLNVETGQVAGSANTDREGATLEFNPTDGFLYLLSAFSSNRLERFDVDLETGELSSQARSSSTAGLIFRIFSDGRRISASTGRVYTLSALAEEAFTESGTLPSSFHDARVDDARGLLYGIIPLNGGRNQSKLAVFDQESLFILSTLDLPGRPVHVLTSSSHAVVIVLEDGKFFSNIYAKDELSAPMGGEGEGG